MWIMGVCALIAGMLSLLLRETAPVKAGIFARSNLEFSVPPQ
jgi:hypothetical protein